LTGTQVDSSSLDWKKDIKEIRIKSTLYKTINRKLRKARLSGFFAAV